MYMNQWTIRGDKHLCHYAFFLTTAALSLRQLERCQESLWPLHPPRLALCGLPVYYNPNQLPKNTRLFHNACTKMTENRLWLRAYNMAHVQPKTASGKAAVIDM